MPTRILGISAYYHDSAACLVEDGRIVAAAQEERFTRKKHDASFPVARGRLLPARSRHHGGASSISSASTRSRSSSSTRLLETYIACAPRGWQSYLMAMPLWLEREALDGGRHPRAARGLRRARCSSASTTSRTPRRRSIRRRSSRRPIVTIDGVGEWATSSIGVGRGHEIELLRELRFPHSLGLLYSAFTYFTGFRVNSGEYKVMGLAPYGEPKYVQTIKDHLLEIRDDGSLWMNMEYFTYPHGLTMTGEQVRRRCSAARRGSRKSKLTQREMDLARSVQDITEEVMLKMARVRAPRDRAARSLSRRRRRAELRRQRPAAARRAVRADLDSAGGRRRRRRARRRAEPLASLSRQAARQRRGSRARGSGRSARARPPRRRAGTPTA